MVNIETIIEKVRNYNSQSNAPRIKSAYKFAERAHDGQLRKSGEPYITHPLCIANALTEYKADEDTIIAALLHDVPEDTGYDLKTIEKKFGGNVAFLVDGVTKVRKEFKKAASSAQKTETLRKIISSIAKDQR
ncbi:HD domain-containing protein, partial [Patescibacteria group bacterium]|nr:HD domain-containing protein [Patescibacteria group bacterium]